MSTDRSRFYSTMGGDASNFPRIALFQAYWKLHSTTLFTSLALSKAGYHVDIFLFKVDEVLHTSLLEKIPNVSIHEWWVPPDGARAVPVAEHCRTDGRANPFNTRFTRSILKKSRRNVERFFTLLRFLSRSNKGLIPDYVLKGSMEVLQRSEYKAFIGIDKGGLTWAGAMAGRLGCPLIYSSLELYTRDHWFYSGCYTQKRLKLAEEHYHRRCWATIVQDEARGSALLADNRIRSEMKMLYVPISRLGEPVAEKTGWLNERLKLPEDQIIILSHGLIAPMRYSLELAVVAQSFPENWTLAIHGYGESRTIEQIRKLDLRNKVRLSLELVDVSEEQKIVGSATISLVFYGSKYLNDKLTGFSSEKLAISLQCGIPIIAFDYPSYEHIRSEGCGILISDLSEIPVAVKRILADYVGFRSRAIATFKTHYQFEKNFIKVQEALAQLP